MKNLCRSGSRLPHVLSLLSLLSLFSCIGSPPETVVSEALQSNCPSPQMNWIVSSTSMPGLQSTLGVGHSTYFYTTTNNRVDSMPSRDTPQSPFGIVDDAYWTIQNATHQVLLQTFGWEKDSYSEATIFDSLRALSRRRSLPGVGPERPRRYSPQLHCVDEREIDVRILFSTASLFGAPQFINTLNDLGDHFDDQGIFVLPCVRVLLGYFNQSLSNLHAKSLVVDGRVAMITSANIVDEWVNEHGFYFQGNIACALQYDFSTAWNRDSTFWYNEKYDFDGDGKKHNGFKCNACRLKTDWCDCYKRGTDYPLSSSALCDPVQPPPLPPGNPSPPECLPAMVISRDANRLDFGTHIGSTHDFAYVAALESAQNLIRIITPNLNTEEVRSNIIYALENGRRVEILLSKNFNDSMMNLLAPAGPASDCQTNEECVKWLVNDAGLPTPTVCSLLDIRWWSVDGVHVVEGNDDKLHQSHGKYLSIDRQVAIVGSSNMDYLSFHTSREIDVVIDNNNIVNLWDQNLFVPAFQDAIRAEALVTRCTPKPRKYLGSDIVADYTQVGWGNYKVDGNWYGSGFNIGGVHYDKGVFAHAASAARFPLDAPYKTLSGCVGLDDSDGSCGDGVRVSVYGDGLPLWTSLVNSGPAECFTLDVSNASTLLLVADPLTNILCDEVEWVNAFVE